MVFGRLYTSDENKYAALIIAVTITAEMFIRMSIDVANFFFGAKSYFLNLNQVSGKYARVWYFAPHNIDVDSVTRYPYKF